MYSPRRPRPAFTLVEILVVMAILALLIGILMPAFSSAIAAGRAAKCASNLRQFGIATQLYLKDNADVFPPHRLPKNPDGSLPVVEVGTGKKVRPTVHAMLAQYMEGAFDTPSQTDQRQSYDSPVMSCPAVPAWIDERNFAYGYNYQFLGNARFRTGSPTSPINFPVSANAVSKPTRTILMADSMGSAAALPRLQRQPYGTKTVNPAALGNHGYALDPPYLASHDGGHVVTADPEVDGNRSAMDPRHNGKANVLFVDGHVDAMTLQKAGYDVADDGSITHGWRTGSSGSPELTGDNRLFTGDYTTKAPPLAN